jgi:hypothetical protein
MSSSYYYIVRYTQCSIKCECKTSTFLLPCSFTLTSRSDFLKLISTSVVFVSSITFTTWMTHSSTVVFKAVNKLPQPQGLRPLEHYDCMFDIYPRSYFSVHVISHPRQTQRYWQVTQLPWLFYCDIIVIFCQKILNTKIGPGNVHPTFTSS